MTIELTSALADMIPVDVREINARLVRDKSPLQISKMQVHHGNRPVELGELFKVSGVADDEQLIWQGNLRHVHHIGYRMDVGKLVVVGTAGNHLGREMSGGQITVHGDVGDHAGSQMRGGLIRVGGSAGDQPGGCIPGAKFGMNRGTILISGNAGSGAGHAMRRGLIAIGGDAMPGLGANMLAGTIIICGNCQPPVGLNMRRGTIVAAGDSPLRVENISRVNFHSGGMGCSPVIGLLANWLEKTGFEFDKEGLDRQQFEQFAGDQVRGGRGELFLRA